MTSQTEVTYHGFTHTCDDPDCHVKWFVASLEKKDAAGEKRLNAYLDTEAGFQ